MAVKKYEAGVKEYRQTYWAPEYVPLDSDILACFKITPAHEGLRVDVLIVLGEIQTTAQTLVDCTTIILGR